MNWALHHRAPPRVAFLVNAFPCRSETFVLNQLSGLRDRGFEVDVIALEPPENVAGDAAPGVHYLNIPHGRAARALKGVVQFAVHFLRHPSTFTRILVCRLLDRATPFVDATLTAAFLLQHGKSYDALHAQLGHLGPLAAVLHVTGVHRGAVVASFRGYDLSNYLRQNGPRTFDRLFREGDRFLPVCEYFAERLRGLSCDARRIVVHRSGIDLTKFPFAPPAFDPGGPLRLVSVGRFVSKKGMRYAIRAMALLRDRNITLSIVGYGPREGKITSLVQRLGLEDRVLLLGERTHEEVREHLAQSHVLMALSVTSRAGDQEGIPNVLKEAMATGLPVIGTRHSGIPELIEDGISGFLVPERDAPAVADRIRTLADHPELWKPITAAARKKIEEEYDGTVLNNELAGLYRDLLYRREAR